MPQQIKPGKYQHYKGKQYEVVGIAHHSETLEPLVVYKAPYESPEFGNNALWVRPLAMFTENIEVEGKLMSRFKYTGRIIQSNPRSPYRTPACPKILEYSIICAIELEQPAILALGFWVSLSGIGLRRG